MQVTQEVLLFRPILLATLLSVSTLSPPALATEIAQDASEPAGKKSPIVASLLSAGAPVGLVGLGFALQRPEVLYVAPLGLGAGQYYAGDPVRGALVGLGAPVAVAAGTLPFLLPGLIERWSEGGSYRYSLPPSYYTLLFGTMLGATISTLAYTGWAIGDAYNTVAEANQSRSQE